VRFHQQTKKRFNHKPNLLYTSATDSKVGDNIDRPEEEVEIA
jgi:hypothetical protein